MPIRRFFKNEYFSQIERDFSFLAPILIDFKGELELAFRENYFSMYYRGNSAVKIRVTGDGLYEISIHKKFYPNSINKDVRFSSVSSDKYNLIATQSNLIPALFQKKYLKEILANIKNINFSEELTFEQMLITDNQRREDLIIIDRQITDTKLQRKRMDLLALRQLDGSRYSFLVLEVKMGNNPELKSKVAEQVNDYILHIRKHFAEYSYCYEKQYQQKKKLGLITIPPWESINIVPEVDGLIVVGGYSGIAEEQIRILKEKFPDIQVRNFAHRL
ncbi:hypothetical protein L0244_00920 [bacterium]|nr:hypothetical protein [bacterium]